MYEYSAQVVSVHDGDTIRADVDLGFSFLARKLDFRLFGINAPEVVGPSRAQGLAARDALRGRILERPVTLRTYRDRTEKYGRYLATVLLAGEVDINAWMVEQGYAVKFMDDILKLSRGDIR